MRPPLWPPRVSGLAGCPPHVATAGMEGQGAQRGRRPNADRLFRPGGLWPLPRVTPGSVEAFGVPTTPAARVTGNPMAGMEWRNAHRGRLSKVARFPEPGDIWPPSHEHSAAAGVVSAGRPRPTAAPPTAAAAVSARPPRSAAAPATAAAVVLVGHPGLVAEVEEVVRDSISRWGPEP